MAIMNVLSLAASGMAAATARFERGAQSIAQGEGDVAEAIVDTIQAKAQFRASAALVRVSDEMMADLLETQRDQDRS